MTVSAYVTCGKGHIPEYLLSDIASMFTFIWGRSRPESPTCASSSEKLIGKSSKRAHRFSAPKNSVHFVSSLDDQEVYLDFCSRTQFRTGPQLFLLLARYYSGHSKFCPNTYSRQSISSWRLWPQDNNCASGYRLVSKYCSRQGTTHDYILSSSHWVLSWIAYVSKPQRMPRSNHPGSACCFAIVS